MLLNQLQQRHAPVLHNVVIRHHRNIHQRESGGIDPPRGLRIGKLIQPAQRERIGAFRAVIEQHRHHQRQRFVPGVQMTLHRRQRVAHQPECHVRIRRALMFNHHVDIAVTVAGFQRPQYVGVAGAQIGLNEAAGLQLKRLQVAQLAQRSGKMNLDKIPCALGMR